MNLTQFFRLAGIGTVLTIWVLSLMPVDDLVVPGSDKLHHFIAYFTCMFVWGQVYRPPLPRIKLAIALIAMGILIECAQGGLTTYRFFEWMDMVANAVGVIAAWLVVTIQLSIMRRYAFGWK